MSNQPPSRVGTPLDRLLASMGALDEVPNEPERITLERAKGAVMLRYGVNSHVAFAMIARWAHGAEIPIMTLAATLVAGAVHNTDFSDDQPPLEGWLDGRVTDGD